jgi:hypothetical protein
MVNHSSIFKAIAFSDNTVTLSTRLKPCDIIEQLQTVIKCSPRISGHIEKSRNIHQIPIGIKHGEKFLFPTSISERCDSGGRE